MDSEYRRVRACAIDFGATPRCSSLEESSLDQLLRGFSLAFRMQPRLFPEALGSDGAHCCGQERRNRVPREGSTVAVYQCDGWMV